ncbi:hypothetical protein HYW20_01190 [Candidatus Woesearchaeota archaeon]|nr:hypothetical protein [Candidatus Woesearchaeota archaeon]
MENLARRLEKRGWGKKEIENAVGIIHNAKQLKTPETRFLEKRIYWILLAVIIAANFAVSIGLFPVLIALKGTFLYFIIALLGIVFGLLFELVIRSIEHLEKKHHLVLAVFIPVIALANLFVVNNISNSVIESLNLENTHNSMIIAFVYAASFVLPYILYRFVLKIEYYSRE